MEINVTAQVMLEVLIVQTIHPEILCFDIDEQEVEDLHLVGTLKDLRNNFHQYIKISGHGPDIDFLRMSSMAFWNICGFMPEQYRRHLILMRMK